MRQPLDGDVRPQTASRNNAVQAGAHQREYKANGEHIEHICRFLLEARRYAPGFDVWRRELLERGDLARHMLERAELGM